MSTDADANADADVDELSRWLAERLDARSVTGLIRLSGGASRETWRFDADGTALILQRQRAADVRDMTVETSVLTAAYAAGLPVAQIVDADTSIVGRGHMVLTAVEGETIARKILRDPEFEVARERLTGQFGGALARLHSIDPATVPALEVTDEVARYRAVLDEVGEPHPTFELVFKWLESNRPPTKRRAVVHGDFRLGNVIVGPEGLRAVVDWELAHIGDPMEDLGWLCVKAWRFGAHLPVAGVGKYHELFDAYEAAGGSAIDPEVVRWWEVLGTLKWGIMCITQASVHRSGAMRSHELAAIGRRVCENEYDLFLALDGRW